jgi:ethanolamine utilization protein EutA (predicted chaperonin)
LDNKNRVVVGDAANGKGMLAEGFLAHDAQVINIPDDGGFSNYTLHSTQSYAKLTCADAGGCGLYLDAATPAAQGLSGMMLYIVNVGANTITVADGSGAGWEMPSSFAMGQWDSIAFLFVGDRWVEISRSDN